MTPVLLVAHRTPPSRARCERLAAAGADLFEIDVQLRHDHIAVSHYAPLRRWRRVQRDNWRLRWHTWQVRDPVIAELAAAVPPERRILLDLKARNPRQRAELAEALVAALPDPRRFVACGPDPAVLARLREAGFSTWRTIGRLPDLAAVLDAGRLPDAAVSVRHSLLSREVVEALHRNVAQIVAWTVNDRRRARQLCRMGVDGITTDRAGVLHELSE